MNGRRKPRQPRWGLTADTMTLAMHRAQIVRRDAADEVVEQLTSSWERLRSGKASELDWSVLAGAVALAKAIENQRVVRGLAEHIGAAEKALQDIYDRRKSGGRWIPGALYAMEIEAVSALVEIHGFQLRQLSLSEFQAAARAATNAVRLEGATAVVSDGSHQMFERIAA